MSDDNKIRLAHELLDEVNAREDLTPRQVRVLRSFLPERPKQKTLAEIASDVYIAWYDTIGSDWDKESYGDLDAWLHELHTHLIEIEDTPAAAPALPAGMCLADHEEYGRVVVSPKPNDIGQYKIFHLDDSYVSGADVSYLEADALTFIDAEPAHPEFLKTVEDYRLAPRDTIVAIAGSHPWIKMNNGMWKTTDFDGVTINLNMSICSRRVLRWGMGDV